MTSSRPGVPRIWCRIRGTLAGSPGTEAAPSDNNPCFHIAHPPGRRAAIPGGFRDATAALAGQPRGTPRRSR
jgi:hypothetical protein